jgi:hypothetical protein
MQQK